MPVKLITAPATEPITLAEAKLHLRVDASATDEDALISALIVAARQDAEHETGRALITQTWELALDCFLSEIRLQKPPIASIVSVKYIDTAGVLQTLASSAYLLDAHSEPGRLTPAYGTCWPANRVQANAVMIQYTAGYADAASVPQTIKNWMLMRIATLYAHREEYVAGQTIAALPFVDRLLDPYRIRSL
jgi:uncharacterized phiE125 gp8 family phage protein